METEFPLMPVQTSRKAPEPVQMNCVGVGVAVGVLVAVWVTVGERVGEGVSVHSAAAVIPLPTPITREVRNFSTMPSLRASKPTEGQILEMKGKIIGWL